MLCWVYEKNIIFLRACNMNIAHQMKDLYIGASWAVLAWKSLCDSIHTMLYSTSTTHCVGAPFPQGCADSTRSLCICIVSYLCSCSMVGKINSFKCSNFLIVKWIVHGLAEEKGREVRDARTCSVFNGHLAVMSQLFLTTMLAVVWK